MAYLALEFSKWNASGRWEYSHTAGVEDLRGRHGPVPEVNLPTDECDSEDGREHEALDDRSVGT